MKFEVGKLRVIDECLAYRGELEHCTVFIKNEYGDRLPVICHLDEITGPLIQTLLAYYELLSERQLNKLNIELATFTPPRA